MGLTQLFEGQLDDAIDNIQSTIVLEAGYPLLVYRYASLGLTRFCQDEYELALAAAETALEVSLEIWLPHLVKIATLQKLSRTVEATSALEVFRENYRDPTVSEWEWLPFTEEEPKRTFLDALRDSGLPE